MIWAGLPGGGGPAGEGAHADPAPTQTSPPALLDLHNIGFKLSVKAHFSCLILLLIGILPLFLILSPLFSFVKTMQVNIWEIFALKDCQIS